MNHTQLKSVRGLALGLTLVFSSVALAAEEDIDWRTIDGGGAVKTTGGGWELSGTIGQPDAGAPTGMSGGTFSLSGGYWSANIPCNADINLNGAVDFQDILAILGAWGDVGGPEDIDQSGYVDFGDILEVLTNWGACP